MKDLFETLYLEEVTETKKISKKRKPIKSSSLEGEALLEAMGGNRYSYDRSSWFDLDHEIARGGSRSENLIESIEDEEFNY